MEKRSENSTTTYSPVVISEDVEIVFTKSTTTGNRTISGQINRGAENAGSVSYEDRGNYLIVSIKPYSSLSPDEVKAVFAEVPSCIAEMLE